MCRKRNSGKMTAYQRIEKIGKSHDGQHRGGASGRLIVHSEDSQTPFRNPPLNMPTAMPYRVRIKMGQNALDFSGQLIGPHYLHTLLAGFNPVSTLMIPFLSPSRNIQICCNKQVAESPCRPLAPPYPHATARYETKYFTDCALQMGKLTLRSAGASHVQACKVLRTRLHHVRNMSQKVQLACCAHILLQRCSLF